jgi:cyclase
MTVGSAVSDAETPKLLEPIPGVFVRQEIDNMGWVSLGDRAVAVDALERAECGYEVVEQLRRTLGTTPLRTLVNTHTHYDHVALNDLLVETFGCDVINPRQVEIPADGIAIKGSAGVLQVLPFGGTHTRDDLVVWAPARRVLFVGDIFGWGVIPWPANLRRDRFEMLVDVYDRLIALDPAVVVPGHGPLCDREVLIRCRRYFTELVDDVRRTVASGVDQGKVETVVRPPEDLHGWWRFLSWKHVDNVRKVEKTVRNGTL